MRKDFLIYLVTMVYGVLFVLVDFSDMIVPGLSLETDKNFTY